MSSKVDICNRALQKLGAKRIVSLDDAGVPNAARCKAAFDMVRDQELRKRAWCFAIKRAQLPADADAPVWGFDNSFTLPADYIRILQTPDDVTDWQVENGKILTNDSAPLNVRYVARIDDTTLYDPNFIEAVASKLAYELCEEVTQSNSKLANLAADYKATISEAGRLNAFEKYPESPPTDDWLTARL